MQKPIPKYFLTQETRDHIAKVRRAYIKYMNTNPELRLKRLQKSIEEHHANIKK